MSNVSHIKCLADEVIALLDTAGSEDWACGFRRIRAELDDDPAVAIAHINIRVRRHGVF